MAGQLAQQIAQMKKEIAMGQLSSSGTASSGWGLGTSPYAVAPADAPQGANSENREGNDTLGNTGTTQFESLYDPQEFAHGFTSENQLHGQFDLSKSPQKIEDVRSAPESQEALTEYYNIIGSYASGEESAISREQVPLEYQELVKQYFERLQQEAAAAKDDQTGESETPPAEDEEKEK